MRIFFLIFLLAYVGGNVYIFIRTLQNLHSQREAGKHL